MYQLLFNNLDWMAFNTLLAIIPVFLGWLAYTVKNYPAKIALFIAWLVFVPNTVYIFTDIVHYFKHIQQVDLLGKVFISLQYLCFLGAGFITYIVSMYPIEKMLKKRHLKKTKNKKFKDENIITSIIIINFMIGLGIVLGRVHRLNSWDFIIAFEKVIDSTLDVFLTPNLFLLTIIFGIFANFLYFLFRKQTIKYFYKKLHFL